VSEEKGRSHHFTAGGQPLRYAVGGAPRARRTLLLFNGIGIRLEAMAPFAAAFERTRVVTFDVPGIGGSRHARWPFGPRDVADWGAAVLDRLGLRTADVCGVSWGGAAAQEFALRHAARCRTLTLAAVGGSLSALPLPATWLRGGPWAGLMRAANELQSMHMQAINGIGSIGSLHQWLAAFGWTSWHVLHRIKQPTLVLVGDDDAMVPVEVGSALAAALPKGTVERVAGGHAFVLTRSHEAAAKVERFIASR
jgi:pimeloyl-ACP methyl ester carboxylesterase